MSDLDDFFAKKDKTKRNKKKGVSNDDFEKKFEVSERKISERSRDKKFAANLEGFIQVGFCVSFEIVLMFLYVSG